VKRANANPAEQDRVVHDELVGPIPPGHELRHDCGLRRCVNPANLEVPTAAERRHLHAHQKADIGRRDGNASIEHAEEHAA
jgi:hypothetical protein